MTESLRNTEQGDVCVNHGGTFEGAYSEFVSHGVPVESEPICSEVDEGFVPIDQGCRFVPADSTDEARMNTPQDERE